MHFCFTSSKTVDFTEYSREVQRDQLIYGLVGKASDFHGGDVGPNPAQVRLGTQYKTWVING